MWKGLFCSEWTKCMSYRWSRFGLLGATVFPPIALLLMNHQKPFTADEALGYCLHVLYLGQAGIVIAAAGFFGQEYRHSVLRTTMLTTGSRIRLLLVKQVLIGCGILLAGCGAIILCLIVLLLAAGNRLSADWVFPFLFAGGKAMCSWLALGFISGNTAILTQSLTAPIALLFPLLLGLSQMLLGVLKLARYLPDLAGKNLFLTPDQPIFLAANWGLAIQLMWVILLGGAAAICFYKRGVR